MFMFCVKEADWGLMAFVAYFVPWVCGIGHRVSPHVPRTVYCVSNALVQAPLGVSFHFMSISGHSPLPGQRRGGGGVLRPPPPPVGGPGKPPVVQANLWWPDHQPVGGANSGLHPTNRCCALVAYPSTHTSTSRTRGCYLRPLMPLWVLFLWAPAHRHCPSLPHTIVLVVLGVCSLMSLCPPPPPSLQPQPLALQEIVFLETHLQSSTPDGGGAVDWLNIQMDTHIPRPDYGQSAGNQRGHRTGDRPFPHAAGLGQAMQGAPGARVSAQGGGYPVTIKQYKSGWRTLGVGQGRTWGLPVVGGGGRHYHGHAPPHGRWGFQNWGGGGWARGSIDRTFDQLLSAVAPKITSIFFFDHLKMVTFFWHQMHGKW